MVKMGRSKRHRQKIKKITESDRIFEKIRHGDKFPMCFGKYPDCPKQVLEMQHKKINEQEIPRACRLCPFFKW